MGYLINSANLSDFRGFLFSYPSFGSFGGLVHLHRSHLRQRKVEKPGKGDKESPSDSFPTKAPRPAPRRPRPAGHLGHRLGLHTARPRRRGPVRRPCRGGRGAAAGARRGARVSARGETRATWGAQDERGKWGKGKPPILYA